MGRERHPGGWSATVGFTLGVKPRGTRLEPSVEGEVTQQRHPRRAVVAAVPAGIALPQPLELVAVLCVLRFLDEFGVLEVGWLRGLGVLEALLCVVGAVGEVFVVHVAHGAGTLLNVRRRVRQPLARECEVPGAVVHLQIAPVEAL